MLEPLAERVGRKVTEPAPTPIEALGGAQCNVCGTIGAFADAATHIAAGTAPYRHSPELREGLACTSCGAISRERALIFTLGRLLGETGPLEHWRERRDTRLFETCGYRGHPPRLERVFDYFNTQYVPFSALPEAVDGRTTADLEDLPYPDGFFDVMLTAEVLEHVQRIEPALDEIHRVLGPAGFAVISAPYVHQWARTSVRVHRWHDRDVFLYPPEYHAEDTLVYRVFGRDLLDQLRARGFAVTFLRLARPEHAIAAMDLIVASKASFVDISHFLSS